MIIYVVYFDYGTSKEFSTLLETFRASVFNIQRDIRFIVKKIEGINSGKINRMMYSNTIKLDAWSDFIQSINEPVILADADMLLIKKIEELPHNFDIGLTTRTSSRLPINAGIVYVNPTDGARKFFREWKEINSAMLVNKAFHEPYKRKYAGMNQAAVGFMIERRRDVANIRFLSCSEWNACEEDWSVINEKTKLVHIKGRLRDVCFGKLNDGRLDTLKIIWRGYSCT